MRDAPRLLLTCALGLVGVAACANMGMPPGGPEDRDPPVIVATIPASETAGVPIDSKVSVVFSEKPDRRSVMQALVVMPPVDFRETSWTDTTLTLVPEEGWVRDRSTLLRIASTAKDRRGNTMEKPFQMRFTTRAVRDSGEVTGRVWQGREVGSQHTVLVAAYRAVPGAADSVSEWPSAVTDELPEGRYRLDGLDTAAAWRIAALADRDADVRAESSGELSAWPPDMIVFREERVVEAPDFLLGTLDSLGALAGTVEVDSGAVAVVFADRDDGFRESRASPGGAFRLEVPTGFVYRVGAFLDADADSLLDEGEPRVDLEETVSLVFTSTRDGIRFDLKGLATEAPPSPAEDDAAGTGEEAP